MGAEIREIRDNDGNIIYPVSVAQAIYMPNGIDTVGRVLNDMKDQNSTITFPINKVEKELASGNKVVTVFNDNGTIVETTYNSDDEAIEVKTTTFNADGSISIVVS